MDNNITEFDVFYSLLRTDFKSFVIKVFNEISGGGGYIDGEYIDLVCDYIVNVINGTQNRLIINIPPRYMKSIICSVALPAFVLGHNPRSHIICVSYSDDLATKFANDTRTVMTSDWYKHVFPQTRISKQQFAKDDFETTVHGGRFATSVGGVLTGRGAEWIIIDDPIKPVDANSEIMRNRVNDWYHTTLFSRLNDKSTGRILLIMQRLHQDDLTGHLLENSDDFQLLRLPIIADTDEAIPFTQANRVFRRIPGMPLHPERESIETVMHIKDSVGELVFSGQYQQLPAPQEGCLIKSEWMRYYTTTPESFTHIVTSWDTASKTGTTNAYSACITLGISADKHIYLLDIYREKLEFPHLANMVKSKFDSLFAAHQRAQHKIVIEDASSGTQLIQFLPELGVRNTYIQAIHPDEDKVARMSGASGYVYRGTVLFPSIHNHFWNDFEKELLLFPNSAFKDQCDAFAQGVLYCAEIIAKPTPRLLVL